MDGRKVMTEFMHTGRYTCRLKNKFGMSEVTAQVIVATEPVITHRFSDLERFIGETAKFTCGFEGLPKPDALWFHNKLPLTVSLPSAFGVTVVPAGASGAVRSVTAVVAAGEVLPAASVAFTDTEPVDCGVADVAV